MESYRTEEEQVEALRNWWKENGQSTIVGIVLALGLGFGWQAWQKNQVVSAENASALYQQMLQSLSVDEAASRELGRELASQIKEDYRGSTYAQFAALHLARLAVIDEQPAEAERQLRWALSMADSGDEVHQVAQLRLARVMAAQGQSEEALALLQGARTDFVASYAIARGDILLSMGQESEALVAYESAVAGLEAGAPLPRSLSEKIQYLSARQGDSEA